MDDTLSFVDLVNQIASLVFAVGLFFIFGRLAPNIKTLALLYAIPILIFIYDIRNLNFNLPMIFYFGSFISLFATCLLLFYGKPSRKEGCVYTNNLLEEAIVRYKLIHQHCKMLFDF